MQRAGCARSGADVVGSEGAELANAWRRFTDYFTRWPKHSIAALAAIVVGVALIFSGNLAADISGVVVIVLAGVVLIGTCWNQSANSGTAEKRRAYQRVIAGVLTLAALFFAGYATVADLHRRPTRSQPLPALQPSTASQTSTTLLAPTAPEAPAVSRAPVPSSATATEESPPRRAAAPAPQATVRATSPPPVPANSDPPSRGASAESAAVPTPPTTPRRTPESVVPRALQPPTPDTPFVSVVLNSGGEREVDVGRRYSYLYFDPPKRPVTDKDLPVTLNVGDGHVTVKTFTEHGVVLDGPAANVSLRIYPLD